MMERAKPGMLGRIISLGAEMLAQGQNLFGNAPVMDTLTMGQATQRRTTRYRPKQHKGFRVHKPAGSKLSKQTEKGRLTLRHTV